VCGPLDEAPKLGAIDLISAISRFGLLETEPTTRQRSVTPLTTLTNPLMDAARLVNAAGLPAQSGFNAAGPLLVTPEIVMRQDADPAPIVPPETLMVDGAVKTTLAAHPAPDTKDVATRLRRNPAGSESTNVIPACAGLPAELVNWKTKFATPPGTIAGTEKFFVKTGKGAGNPPTITATLLVVEICGNAPTCWLLAAELEINVPGGGITAQLGTPMLPITTKRTRTSPPNLAQIEDC
jgi:hypothetical protein